MRKTFFQGMLPFPLLLLAVVALTIAIFMFSDDTAIAIFIMIPAIIILTAHDNLVLDLQQRSYRIESNILFIRFGNWKPIPDDLELGLRFVVLKGVIRGGMSMNQSTYRIKSYELYMIWPGSKKIVLKHAKDWVKLNAIGQSLAESLNANMVVDWRIAMNPE